jgi:membrane protease YdiL (CAAX protease family)
VSRGRAAAAVLGATALYAAGIAVGVAGNVWLGTSVAATLSAALVVWAAPGGFWRRLVSGWTPAAVGLAAGLVMILATHVGFRLVLALAPGLEAHVDELYRQLDDWPGRPAAAGILAVVVVVEELVWRGLAVDLLRPRLAPALVVVAAAGLYAIPQLATGSLLVAALGFGCGLLWTTERLVTRSLAAPLVTHLVWDLGVFIVWPVT